MAWHNKSIQATGRGAGALTRQAFWPAPELGRSAETGNYETCGTEEQWN